ncbi:hypothetical protein [Microtetraspora malaysiensis]|uniref:hypothetical protein n=1 Tax=Microtetraspora malaysiensis TaxID=161358 RepID=UPI00082FD050|nr:hypothetical protein [Microtetraspora malaysiensis]
MPKPTHDLATPTTDLAHLLTRQQQPKQPEQPEQPQLRGIELRRALAEHRIRARQQPRVVRTVPRRRSY